MISSVATSNAIGGENIVDYTYSGAKYNLQGRNFLGFKIILAKNRVTGIEDYTFYKQNFPYIGRAYANVKTLDDIIISKQIKSYNAKYSFDNKITYLYVHIDQNFTYKFDGALVKMSQSFNTTVDMYGNTTRNDLYSYDGNLSRKSFMITLNQYDNNESSWILGRLKKVDAYYKRTTYRNSWFFKVIKI